MNTIENWLTSIIIVVIFGAIIDMIMPKSTMSKYIKYIYSIFIMYVIIQPILYINSNKFDFNYSELINNQFTSYYQEKYEKILEDNIEQQLYNVGLKNVNVQILSENVGNEIKFVMANIFLNNLVIDKNFVHINEYQVLEDIITSTINIDKENIFYYE